MKEAKIITGKAFFLNHDRLLLRYSVVKKFNIHLSTKPLHFVFNMRIFFILGHHFLVQLISHYFRKLSAM